MEMHRPFCFGVRFSEERKLIKILRYGRHVITHGAGPQHTASNVNLLRDAARMEEVDELTVGGISFKV